MDLLYFRQQKRNSRLAHCCGIFTRGQVFIMMCSLCRMEKREKKIFNASKKAEDYEKTVFKGLFYLIAI